MSETQTQNPLTPGFVEVGDGVTYGVGSDRYAATVVKTSPSGKTVYFVDDDYKMAPEGDYFGTQVWEYTSVEPAEWVDLLGETRTNVKTARWSAKRNGFVYGGRTLSRGRHARQDPSF